MASEDEPVVRIWLDTPLGRIEAEIFVDRAPITAGNFLCYVDRGLYTGATFYRALRPDNGQRTPRLRAIQGGIDPSCVHPALPPIQHESTKKTGLRHLDGSLSLARWDVGTAASEFFIVLGEAAELDADGAYGEGYAVFGRVVNGMDIVRLINASPTTQPSTIDYMVDQALEPVPVHIRRAPRVFA